MGIQGMSKFIKKGEIISLIENHYLGIARMAHGHRDRKDRQCQEPEKMAGIT
jgi:hypothetical protein